MPTVLFLLVDLEQSNGCVVPNWGVIIPRGCQSTGKLVSIKLGLIPKPVVWKTGLEMAVHRTLP